MHLLQKKLRELPRIYKQIAVISLDISSCVLATWFAFYLRLGEWVSLNSKIWNVSYTIFISTILLVTTFLFSGLYQTLFREFDESTVKKLLKSLLVYLVLFSILINLGFFEGIPRTIGLIQALVVIFLIIISRIILKKTITNNNKVHININKKNNILIYGAGITGRQFAINVSKGNDFQVIAFVDDDVSLTNAFFNRIKIYHPISLEMLINKYDIHFVFIAIPSLSLATKNLIYEKLKNTNVKIKITPNLLDYIKAESNSQKINELNFQDLLGREQAVLEQSPIADSILNKVILVSGAGGTIGSELCRQILSNNPKALILVDSSEYALYQIYEEIKSNKTNSSNKKIICIPVIASVTDKNRISNVLKKWKPDFIYHAAAHKHVNLVEENPAEGIWNNVFGTLVIAELAILYNVSKFVLISTDKAVRPTSIMGASKRIAEMILQALSDETNNFPTNFAIVRFGNVLGSSGSVIPKFLRQIKNGGPVTVSHSNVTRYFMTVGEAAQLVLFSSILGNGGDIFLLEMGKPVKILNMAENLIKLHNIYDQNSEKRKVEIVFTGLTPGEKLYEELVLGMNPQPTANPKILKAKENFLNWKKLKIKLDHIKLLVENDDLQNLSIILMEVVEGYQPSSSIKQ